MFGCCGIAYIAAGWPAATAGFKYSSVCVEPPGETPGTWLGLFQLLVVAGDFAGDSSSFKLVPRAVDDATDCMADGAIMPGVFGLPTSAMGFLRCARCFSSMCKRPSLVNGLGRTSFIPNCFLVNRRLCNPAITPYRAGSTWQYHRS
jgi:hypothetical protein